MALNLTIRCPICGNCLKLIENRLYVILKCSHCGREARTSKRRIFRNYVEYGRSARFKWSELLRELYMKMH